MAGSAAHRAPIILECTPHRDEKGDMVWSVDHDPRAPTPGAHDCGAILAAHYARVSRMAGRVVDILA